MKVRQRGRPPTSGVFKGRKTLVVAVRRMRGRGETIEAICRYCGISASTVLAVLELPIRQRWTGDEVATLRAMYPTREARDIAAAIGRPMDAVYRMAVKLGIRKDPTALAAAQAANGERLKVQGAAHRFPKGHAPMNKGKRQPGYARGRMRETQFKKGEFPSNWDRDFYVLGALRVNADGYIDMRVSFDAGARGWRGLHLILWEDAHGPIPPGHCVVFKNGDTLDVELDNLECITRAENMRRNTIHNMPESLRSAVMQLGQLRRRINERAAKEDGRGFARAPVRDDGRSTGRNHERREGKGDRRSRPGDRQLREG